MKQSMLLFSFLVLAIAMVLSSCIKKASTPVSEMTPAQLAERGKAIYVGNCIACHNKEPQKEGSVGPAVAGSSLELLDARIMRAEFPQNFKPKRDTRTMAAMPHLQSEIPALAAYLASISIVGESTNP